MGEKGIGDVATAAVAREATSGVAAQVAGAVTGTTTGVATDLLGTTREKAIGAVADNVVTAAREKLTDKGGALSGTDGEQGAGEAAAP